MTGQPKKLKSFSLNAGEFRHRITIVDPTAKDADGFATNGAPVEVCKAWAQINTTKGYTLISQGSAFEDATTRFLIRMPSVELSRKYLVIFRGKQWRIRYLNNLDESNKFVELQCEEITT